MPDVFGDQPVGSAVGTCPSENGSPKKTYWLEIELVGEDDKPIPWEEYLVVLPDGTSARGFLDGAGFARFTGLTVDGQCKVSFQKLDRDAWELVSTQEQTPSNG